MESVEKFRYKTQYIQDLPEVWETLQGLARTGWVTKGIPKPETVAEHVLS
jgi:5'-deoxynucleotidase YfbR-like HD superfamily hydrolase